MKKYFKTKGVWSFWFVVLVAAIAIYLVAWQAGLTIQAVNNFDSSSLVVSVKKTGTVKTPAVPTKYVAR